MGKLYRYDIAIVAIMKNEGINLEEWIAYHTVAGVEKFYLYDNESTDNTSEVLDPYIKSGLVDYVFLPTTCKGQMQYTAYNHAIVRHRFECKYMAFVDIDEFIVPTETVSIGECVDSLLKAKPLVAGLTVNWNMFGSSGRIQHPEEGCIYALRYRSANDCAENVHVKSIVNPRRVLKFFNPHFPLYLIGFKSYNELGLETLGPFDATCSTKKIRINHYYAKSKEDWEIKMGRGIATDMKDLDNYTWEMFRGADRNDVYDDRIIRYLEQRIELLSINAECKLSLDNTEVDYIDNMEGFISGVFYSEGGLRNNIVKLIEYTENRMSYETLTPWECDLLLTVIQDEMIDDISNDALIKLKSMLARYVVSHYYGEVDIYFTHRFMNNILTARNWLNLIDESGRPVS